MNNIHKHINEIFPNELWTIILSHIDNETDLLSIEQVSPIFKSLAETKWNKFALERKITLSLNSQAKKLVIEHAKDTIYSFYPFALFLELKEKSENIAHHFENNMKYEEQLELLKKVKNKDNIFQIEKWIQNSVKTFFLQPSSSKYQKLNKILEKNLHHLSRFKMLVNRGAYLPIKKIYRSTHTSNDVLNYLKGIRLDYLISGLKRHFESINNRELIVGCIKNILRTSDDGIFLINSRMIDPSILDCVVKYIDEICNTFDDWQFLYE